MTKLHSAWKLKKSLWLQSVKVTSDEDQKGGLTELRVRLLRSAGESLLHAGGFRVEPGGKQWLHFTGKNCGGEGAAEFKRVSCGPVVNSTTKAKETQVSAEDYRRFRLNDLRATSEGKNLEEHVLETLVDACVKITLLQVKSNQAVTLNLEPECKGPRESGSKGGAFLQYNASRMAAIRKKYGERSNLGIYPPVPAPEDVDFSVLNEPEEWALLFNFLLDYPSMIGRLSKTLAEGKSNIHQLPNFLSKMSSLFSVYYRRVRILLEPRKHLFGKIHSRLLLMMSVEQVLENGFSIFNINKLEEM